MNETIFKGKWNQLKGKIKEKWGKLTDSEIDQIKGKKDQLIGKIQEKYGYSKEKAEKELAAFVEEEDESNC